MPAMTTALIKEMREAAGAGPLDCRQALEASSGDLDQAEEALREKGMAKALQKAERETNAGLVIVKAAGGAAVLAEARSRLTEVVAGDRKPEAIKAK